MSGYRLTLICSLPTYLDARPLEPGLIELPLAQIEAMPLLLGRKPVLLKELFAVSSIRENALLLEGDLSLAQYMGAGLAAGRLEVFGPVGDRAGQGMRGGELILHANAGDSLGENMHLLLKLPLSNTAPQPIGLDISSNYPCHAPSF